MCSPPPFEWVMGGEQLMSFVYLFSYANALVPIGCVPKRKSRPNMSPNKRDTAYKWRQGFRF